MRLRGTPPHMLLIDKMYQAYLAWPIYPRHTTCISSSLPSTTKVPKGSPQVPQVPPCSLHGTRSTVGSNESVPSELTASETRSLSGENESTGLWGFETFYELERGGGERKVASQVTLVKVHDGVKGGWM